MKIVSILLATLCWLAASDEKVAAEMGTSQSTALQSHCWDVLSIQFEVSNEPEDPFDVPLSVNWTHESGEKLVVPGFWNGSNKFMVRFTPPKAGRWQYLTESQLQELSGRNGNVDVAEPRPGRCGGVIIDNKTKLRFRYQNGDSYSPIAFECDWLFALDAENPNDIPKTKLLVDELADNGFDQIVMNVFAYDVNWPKDKTLRPEYDFGSPSVFPFGGNNENPDHSRLNVEYFQRLDRVIEYLDAKEIAAHLMIYVWNKRVNWPEANSKEDNRYFDYVVKRYQAYPNMVWDISKEALGYGHNDVDYITGRIKRLRDLDAHKRLITVHDYSYCRRFPKEVDFISVQLWQSELYNVMREVRKQFPDQPILNIEHGGYEESPYVVFTGNYTSAEVCLERSYQCVFAGTYPSHYWQGAAWNVIIPDIQSLPPDDRPKLQFYRHLRELTDKYKLDQLKSGDKLSSSGFCLHNGKDLYLYYVPKENTSIGVRLPKRFRGQEMTGCWFNPLNGTYSQSVKKKIDQWPKFDKPTDLEFAVLVVEVIPSDGTSSPE